MEKAKNIVKLAPTLSAKERFKLMLADCNKTLDTEKGIFNEEERAALIYFTELRPWSEYAYLWGLFLTSRIVLDDWIRIAWLKFTIILDHLVCFDVSLADHGLKSALKEWKILMPWPPEELVKLAEERIRILLEYEDMTNEIKEIFGGSHPFNESRRTEFNDYFKNIKEVAEFHNSLVDLARDPKIRELKIKKMEPDPETVKEGIATMKDFVKGLCRLLGADYEHGEKAANN